MPKKNALSAEDWLKAGFRALSRNGLAAVKAEALARDLKVSKGSFYWHFEDVPALKAAMLEHWSRKGTEDIIARVGAGKKEAAAQLRMLAAEAAGDDTSEYGGPAVQAAIREWARYDAAAALALQAVDRRRLSYVAGLFSATGFPPEEASRRARLLYGALIGLEALPGEKNNLGPDLNALLEILLRAKP